MYKYCVHEAPVSPKTLNVSEARRLLPSLIRRVAVGGAVPIGTRGQATAILIGFQEYQELRDRGSRPRGGQGGWARLKLEAVGGIEEVEAALLELRQERAAGRPDSPKRRAKKRRSPSR
jgi:antitoxin (DNA-binding transcriptional repressor) of toxin-antitoxin stability system